MVKYYTYEMQFEDEDREITAEDRELEKQQTEYYSKVIYPEDIGSQDSIPYDDDDDDDDDDDGNNNNNDDDDDDDSSEEDELYTIKDFPHLQEQEQEQEIKPPKLSRDAADVDAVKNVLEGIIQSPTSTKNICGVHRLDQQILNKVLENLKNSITQETLNQLTNSLQLAEEDNETASPVPLQAPPHDKVQVHEHRDERKGKLTSYIPAAAAAAAAAAATATVNNVSEEMTQLPASKKIRYAYDDDGKSLKNLITQETSINLQNVSEQLAEDNETASPVSLQAPPHDKAHEHQERKRKLSSYIPYSAAAATVNNVSEEMTQLPASKKIRYAHDDDEKSLKNLITQETSINLQNVSEQVADIETAFLAKLWKGDSCIKFKKAGK